MVHSLHLYLLIEIIIFPTLIVTTWKTLILLHELNISIRIFIKSSHVYIYLISKAGLTTVMIASTAELSLISQLNCCNNHSYHQIAN